MSKFTASKFLSKADQQELFIDFAYAFASIKSSVEAANFLKDLLSESEALMLARRLQIARLLLDGLTYEQIRKLTKAGFATITKVQTWLNLYGEGYRTVVERTKNKNRPQAQAITPWRSLKRKYPMYFWPQLLLEEIVKSANSREKQRLTKVLQDLKEKKGLNKELMKILQLDKHYHPL